jgi:PAS domain-containing protein
MTSDDKFLRKKAEDLYEKREHANISFLNSAEIEKLVTELELKNIEYEFKTEELISERDIAAAAAAKFNKFYESAAMGYFTLNSDSIITEMNMSGASMLGGKRSDLAGRKFRSFISPETLPEFDEIHDENF